MMRIATNAVGSVPASINNFGGTIQGKVPQQSGLAAYIGSAASTVTQTYTYYTGSGAVVTHTIKGADPVKFNNVKLGGGPLSVYPDTIVNGTANYDPEEGNWYLDITAAYSSGGMQYNDHYTGSIAWTEDPNRKANGKGYYSFNLRMNEKPVSPSDLFKASDAVADFFATNNTIPGFTGTVTYVDTWNSDASNVIASKVVYAVDGNQVSRIQTMNLNKILMLMVGPWNDE